MALLLALASADDAVDPFAIYLVYDNFTEALDTPLASHVPDKDEVGLGWVEHGGSWTVQGLDGVLTCSGVGGTVEATIEVGTKNHNVEVGITLVATGIGVLEARFTDANNQVALVLFEDTDTIGLYRAAGGAFPQLDTAPITLVPGVLYRLRLAIGADNIAHGFVDDVEYVSGDVSLEPPGTRAGLESGHVNNTHDYLWVKEVV